MQKRIDILSLEPAANKAMYGLATYQGTVQLTHTHAELIKIRASQINGCAFCLDMHTKDALKYGESPQRIFLLDAWRETELYTPEERAILALTEEVTLISKHGVSDATYTAAEELFEPNYLAQILMAIVTINSWNRIAISTNKPLGK